MQNGQSGLHGRGLDSSSELRSPVYLVARSQPTTNAGSPIQTRRVRREIERVVDRLGH